MTFRLAQTIRTAACLSLAVVLAMPLRAMGEEAVTPRPQSVEQQTTQIQPEKKKPPATLDETGGKKYSRLGLRRKKRCPGW